MTTELVLNNESILLAEKLVKEAEAKLKTVIKNAQENCSHTTVGETKDSDEHWRYGRVCFDCGLTAWSAGSYGILNNRLVYKITWREFENLRRIA